MNLLFVLLSCFSVSIPEGTWRLNGIDTIGMIKHGKSGWGSKTEVALFTPHASTNGLVECRAEVESDVTWLRFPIETGFGLGEASIRLQGKEAFMPLGTRYGEFGNRMTTQKNEQMIQSEIDDALNKWGAIKVEDEKNWKEGSFLILDADEVVGFLQLIPEQPAEIHLFDSFWMTPGLVAAERFDEGADIVLLFPVEPSFDGEDGLLRLNTIAHEITVPTSDVPSDLDRRLSISAGKLGDVERNKIIEHAQMVSIDAEREIIQRDGAQLARWAKNQDGCSSFQDWVSTTGYDWRGYKVEIQPEEGQCVVVVESDPIQHRRHFSGKINQNGILVASGD